MYLFGLALMVVALPLSKYLISVTQFYLSGVLIIDNLNREKGIRFIKENSVIQKVLLFIPFGLAMIINAVILIFRKFFRKSNAPALIFVSIYLLHIIGLIFTNDFDYALKDLRVKLPIFILPLIISTSEALDKVKFRRLILIFVAAVIIGTLLCTNILLTKEVIDIRDISIFISHIRFSLMIVLAIFFLVYSIFERSPDKIFNRVIYFIILSWLVAYLFISVSLTGIVVLSITTFILLLYLIMKKKNLLARISTLAVIFIVAIVAIIYLNRIIKDVNKVNHVDLTKLEKVTGKGNNYWHDTTNKQTENGNYVWIYIATNEMRDAWNKRSDFDFDGKDKKSQDLKFTLIRFLTSKGYRKDTIGVSKLTDEEVRLVENGVANSFYHEKPNFHVRLYKTVWAFKMYQVTKNPSGNSVMQRFEYWRTSLKIIKENFWLGVGTGDMNQVFNKQYKKMNSSLEKRFRWRSHNQFMAIFIGFGIFGLIWFLFSFLYPPLKLKMFNDYYYLAFFIIITLSMLFEDTIETQAGVTFYAFFSAFFLFGRKSKAQI